MTKILFFKLFFSSCFAEKVWNCCPKTEVHTEPGSLCLATPSDMHYCKLCMNDPEYTWYIVVSKIPWAWTTMVLERQVSLSDLWLIQAIGAILVSSSLLCPRETTFRLWLWLKTVSEISSMRLFSKYNSFTTDRNRKKSAGLERKMFWFGETWTITRKKCGVLKRQTVVLNYLFILFYFF